MNRPNPYESPPEVLVGKSPRSAFVLPLLVALVAITLWAIFQTSIVGVLIPAAIGFAASSLCQARPRRMLGPIALAYIVGVGAIILASIVADSILDPMWSFDDQLSLKVTRVWAACGVIGAIAGAMIGVRIGQPNAKQHNEQLDQPE